MAKVVDLDIPGTAADREARRVRVQGVGRVGDNPNALMLILSREPTDDDMRRLHDFLGGWR